MQDSRLGDRVLVLDRSSAGRDKSSPRSLRLKSEVADCRKSRSNAFHQSPCKSAYCHEDPAGHESWSGRAPTCLGKGESASDQCESAEYRIRLNGAAPDRASACNKELRPELSDQGAKLFEYS